MKLESRAASCLECHVVGEAGDPDRASDRIEVPEQPVRELLIDHDHLRPDRDQPELAGERQPVRGLVAGCEKAHILAGGNSGSRPDRGINALEKMSALVLALEDYKTVLAQRTFLTPEGKTMRPPWAV